MFFFEWFSLSKDSYHPQYHKTFVFLIFLIHINIRAYILFLVYLLETYKSYLQNMFVILLYFVSWVEEWRRDFLSWQNFLITSPGGGGVWEGTQAFIIGVPSMLLTDNEKEFVNNTLSSWLENRGIRHVLGWKYHPQNQDAVESFNKTIQRFLNEAFTNSIFNWEENKWSLRLMITDFLFTIIASANIQQLRWHQEKFYLITKIKRWLRK